MRKRTGESGSSGNPPTSVRISTTATWRNEPPASSSSGPLSSDWCAPTFLERCLAELQEQPDAVLAVPRTRLFEGNLEVSRVYDRDIEVIDETPSAR